MLRAELGLPVQRLADSSSFSALFLLHTSAFLAAGGALQTFLPLLCSSFPSRLLGTPRLVPIIALPCPALRHHLPSGAVPLSLISAYLPAAVLVGSLGRPGLASPGDSACQLLPSGLLTTSTRASPHPQEKGNFSFCEPVCWQ